MARKSFSDTDKDRLVDYVKKVRADAEKKGQRVTIPEACALAKRNIEPFKSLKDYSVQSVQSLYTFWWGVKEGKPYMNKKKKDQPASPRQLVSPMPGTSADKTGALELLERAVDAERKSGLTPEARERAMRILEKLLDA